MVLAFVALLSGCIGSPGTANAGPADADSPPDTGTHADVAPNGPDPQHPRANDTTNVTWVPGNITERFERAYEYRVVERIGGGGGGAAGGNCFVWTVPADADIRELTVDVDATFSSGREDAFVLSAVRLNGSQVVERDDSEPVHAPAQVTFRDFSVLQGELFVVMFTLDGPAVQTDFQVEMAAEWETQPVEAQFTSSGCAN